MAVRPPINSTIFVRKIDNAMRFCHLSVSTRKVVNDCDVIAFCGEMQGGWPTAKSITSKDQNLHSSLGSYTSIDRPRVEIRDGCAPSRATLHRVSAEDDQSGGEIPHA
jgi:hypothetical protein